MLLLYYYMNDMNNLKREMIDLLITVNELPNTPATLEKIEKVGNDFAERIQKLCNDNKKCKRCVREKKLKNGFLLVAPVLQVMSFHNDFVSLWKYNGKYYTYCVKTNKVWLDGVEVGLGKQTPNRMYFKLFHY